MVQPQTLQIQAKNGTWKSISSNRPIPAWVVGLDELPEQIASRIGTHIIKPPDVHVATPAVTVEPPAVTVEAPTVVLDLASLADTIERCGKLGLYAVLGMGVLQIALILTLVFTR